MSFEFCRAFLPFIQSVRGFDVRGTGPLQGQRRQLLGLARNSSLALRDVEKRRPGRPAAVWFATPPRLRPTIAYDHRGYESRGSHCFPGGLGLRRTRGASLTVYTTWTRSGDTRLTSSGSRQSYRVFRNQAGGPRDFSRCSVRARCSEAVNQKAIERFVSRRSRPEDGAKFH